MPLSPSSQNQEHYSPLASIYCHPLSNSESGSLGLFHFPCSKTPQSCLSKLRAPSSFLLHPQILLTVEPPTPARSTQTPQIFLPGSGAGFHSPSALTDRGEAKTS